jgi:hypothetical protein
MKVEEVDMTVNFWDDGTCFERILKALRLEFPEARLSDEGDPYIPGGAIILNSKEKP